MENEYYKRYEPFWGSWYIKRFIGAGSYGKVFEIEERDSFGNVYTGALKAITVPSSQGEIDELLVGMSKENVSTYFDDYVEGLNREIVLMSKLTGNSNIVSYQAHKAIRHDNGIGWDILIRMELLTPLNTYINANGALDEQMVIKLGIDICKALEICKQYNVIHRDIKPANIFISETRNFKLGDFGIARIASESTGASTKAGTANYMAPEVFQGKKYTSNVDTYSLGVVMYQLLNANRLPLTPPYPEEMSFKDREQALAQRLSGAPLPPPLNASAPLANIVLKACAPSPADRYESPTEMRQELERCPRENQKKEDICVLPHIDDIPTDIKDAPGETIDVWALARKQEEERKRKEEEARKAEEERKRQEEEARKAEEARRQREEEERQKQLEAARRAEEERKRKEEAARKAEEERKQKEDEARKAEEERKQREEAERKRKEEEKRKTEKQKKIRRYVIIVLVVWSLLGVVGLILSKLGNANSSSSSLPASTSSISSSSEAASESVSADEEEHGVLIYYVSGGGTLSTDSASGLSEFHLAEGDQETEVTAVPDDGYEFSGWDDGVTEATRQDELPVQDTTIAAVFVQKPASTSSTSSSESETAVTTYTASYTVSGSGTLTSGTAKGKTKLELTVEEGKSVSVKAVPGTDYHFVRWSDGSTDPTRTDKNIKNNLKITAVFEANPVSNSASTQITVPEPTKYTVQYTASGEGKIQDANGSKYSNLSYTVTSSDVVSVAAVASSGYHFVKWSDGNTSATRTDRNFGGNVALTATFEKDADPVTEVKWEYGNYGGGIVIYGYSGSSSVSSLNIPSKINGLPVVKIDKYAFSGRSEIHSVSIPSSVTEIGMNAFAGTSITSVKVPAGCTVSDSAFPSNCSVN